MIKELTATVFVKVGNIYQGKKYTHNIKDLQHYIGKFCNDMKIKYPTADYINFYYKHNGEFKERIYIE